ncbi:MAG: DUF3570 domain-containing protein [Acidiferrobacterales bacterium]
MRQVRQSVFGRVLGRLVMALVVGTLDPLVGLAAVLEDQRFDAMYHYYNGDNTTVDGPALLVRKNFAEKTSVSAAYYADAISSASIDVVTTASPFTDRRTEVGLGVDYLHRNTLFSLSLTTSEENDYDSDAVNFNLSQEMFGGMTTITMGYGRGDDVVRSVDDPNFEDEVDRDRYRLGLSQILSKTLLFNVDYEAITDEGFLNSPYRAARIQGALVPERYPRTRESQALAFRVLKYLDPNRSIRLGYRYFSDTWDIKAHDVEIAFNKYLGSRWLLEVGYRYYTQDAASFYSDNFQTEQNFMARDKELSTFTSNSIGGKVTYTFLEDDTGRIGRGTLNVAYNHIEFDYDDFTDIRTGKLFSFDADVVQLFVSLWY